MPGQSTDQGRAQNQKLEALGRFAGGIAHDFNNILSVIDGLARAAQKQARDGQVDPLCFDKIIQAAQRGAGLTRQLLAFARQKVAIDEKIDLSAVLRRQDVLLHPVMGGGVRVDMLLPEEEVWVRASEDQIAQIVINIALNARDAMGGLGGTFSVVCGPCVRNNGSYARLSFSDTGPGISDDVLPRIFDPFFTTKAAGQGTGLGLSVVHGIAETLGAELEVRSETGKGATFDLYFPIVQAEAGARDEEGAARADCLEGKTVLLAEDEPELRDVLALLLKDMKMKVIPASNGNHAMRLQEEYKGEIDVLLTDVIMPEMGGVQLSELFRADRPDAKVLYMSGYPFLDGNRNVRLPPGASFISKPLQEKRLRQVLERALERRDARLAADPAAD